MSQKNKEASLAQSVLMSRFTKIAQWMQKYEQREYDKERKAKNLPPQLLPENAKTRILSTGGFCFGLSSLLVHSVITDHQIENKKQPDEELKKDPYVDKFYERIDEVNSLKKIPPNTMSEKAFYGKMNILMLELVQLQSFTDRLELQRGGKQIMEDVLNEASDEENQKKNLHTYLFTDKSKLLEWAQKAQAGDALSVGAQKHAMAIYVRNNSKGKRVVGFYDPNNAKRIEIAQSELKSLKQIEKFRPFHSTHSDKKNYFPLLICRHIAPEKDAETRTFPEIVDNSLDNEQRKEAIFSQIYYGTKIDREISFKRLFQKEIELSRQGNKEATKMLFDMSNNATMGLGLGELGVLNEYVQRHSNIAKDGDQAAMRDLFYTATTSPDLLTKANVLPEEHIQRYSDLAKGGDRKGGDRVAMKDLFDIAIRTPDLLTKANISPEEHIQLYSDLAKGNDRVAMRDLFYTAITSPDLLTKANISPKEHIQRYSDLAKGNDRVAMKDLFEASIHNPKALNEHGVSPKEHILLYHHFAEQTRDPEALSTLFHQSMQNPEALRQSDLSPEDRIHSYNELAKSGDKAAMKDLFFSAIYNPEGLKKVNISPTEHMKRYCELAEKEDKLAMADLFSMSIHSPQALIDAKISPEEHIKHYIGLEENKDAANGLFKDLVAGYIKPPPPNSSKYIDLFINEAVRNKDTQRLAEVVQLSLSPRLNLDISSIEQSACNLSTKDNELGKAMMQWSIKNHRSDLVKQLSGKFENNPYKVLKNAAVRALGRNNPEQVDKADIDLVNDAVKKHDHIMLRNLIQHNVALEPQAGDMSNHPLRTASSNRADKCAAELLNAGVKMPDNDTLKSLMARSKNSIGLANAMLFYAAKNNSPEIMLQLMKDKKCDVLAKDGEGKSALVHAKEHSNTKVVEILERQVLQKISPINDKDGYTPLDLAKTTGHQEIAKELPNTAKKPNASIPNNVIKDMRALIKSISPFVSRSGSAQISPPVAVKREKDENRAH